MLWTYHRNLYYYRWKSLELYMENVNSTACPCLSMVFITTLFAYLFAHQQARVVITLWSLWKSRTVKLWKSMDNSLLYINTSTKGTLNECSCMQRAKTLIHNKNYEHTWIKPRVDMIKCNVDATAFNNNYYRVWYVFLRLCVYSYLANRTSTTHQPKF
jgi:hypothetical protein